MTVLLTGANGFTGRFVCAELKRRHIPFICLLRPGSDRSWMDRHKFPVRFADLNDHHQLAKQLKGCNALLNIASLGFGAAPSIVAACVSSSVRRVVFVSTTSIFTNLNARSKLVRIAAEELIASSGLEFTILRPTMIYGTPGDRNIIRLVRWIDRWPVLPVFGDGCSLQQPVHVSDVAWSVVQSLSEPATINREFNVPGASALAYNDIIRITAHALGRRVHCLHIPSKPVVSALQLLERLGTNLPIKAEQVLRLNEDKVFSFSAAEEIFNYRPMSFDQGIRHEVSLYRSSKDGYRP